MPLLLDLFLTFAKIGAMTFGGGLAMLPILQREVVDNKGWCSQTELGDYYAIGQCTPGIIAVNTATFVGQKQAGIPGGVIATLGLVFPSLILITALAGVISAFSHLDAVAHAFAGIRVCVCVLIFNSVCKLGKQSIVDILTAVIAVAVCLLAYFVDVSPIVFVLGSALIGIVVRQLKLPTGAFKGGEGK